MIDIQMLRASCRAYTFDDPKVMKLMQSLNEGFGILNLYAGKNVISYDEVRVDLRSFMFDLTYNISDSEFLKMAKLKNWFFQTIFYDPDWNDRKSKEFYNGAMRGKYTRYKDDIVSLLTKNGIIISAGYEIDNFGKLRGMELEKIIIVNPSGEQKPFFITVERKNTKLVEIASKRIKLNRQRLKKIANIKYQRSRI